MEAGKTMHIMITNDDGPPSEEHSPFLLPFFRAIQGVPKWRTSVFIPATQQSWISKAHQITGEIEHSYYDPETSVVSRTIPDNENNPGKYFNLLSGTPATCVNIALHHLLSSDPVDLVISGPNFGRNSSSTFITSSGTVGGAQEAWFCGGKKAVAVSFAFLREEGFGEEDIDRGCQIALKVIQVLLENWPAGIHLFNINVPVFTGMPDSLEVYQTFIYQNSYGSLFKAKETDRGKVYKFHPDPARLFVATPPVGSDAWALKNKHVSVTPLLTSFAEANGLGGIIPSFKMAGQCGL